MYIRYTRTFIQKLTIPQYPLKGFYGTFQSARGGYFDNDLTKYNSSSKLVMNTVVYKDFFRISFKLNGLDESNHANMLYLYAIDMFKYDDATQWESRKLTSQLAGIIYLQDDDLKPEDGEESHEDLVRINTVNILNFYPKVGDTLYPIKASFHALTMRRNPSMGHYAEPLLGQVNAYKYKDNNYYLLDKGSGLQKLKDQLPYQKDAELLGDWCVTTSGLIQL